MDLRSQNRLLYAIYDFDHSIKLPPGVDRTQFRLPYHKSWGTINVVADTKQGEYDFNPFVFDVGALGVSLCHSYQVRYEQPSTNYFFLIVLEWPL